MRDKGRFSSTTQRPHTTATAIRSHPPLSAATARAKLQRPLTAEMRSDAHSRTGSAMATVRPIPKRNTWINNNEMDSSGARTPLSQDNVSHAAKRWRQVRSHSRNSEDSRPGSASKISRAENAQTAQWNLFSEQLKLIGDDSHSFVPRKLTIRQSMTFSEVMSEIEAKKKAEKEKEEALKASKVSFNKDKLEDDKPRTARKIVDKRAQMRRIQAAKRGWTLVRRAVQEIKMERQTQADLQWSFLKQTITNMTDMEKSRQEMYKKYIYKPNTWGEGIENFEEKLKIAVRKRDEQEREKKKKAKIRPKSGVSNTPVTKIGKPSRSVTSL